MKQLFTMLALLMAASMNSAFAQADLQPELKSGPAMPALPAEHRMAAKGTDLASRLIAQSYYRYNNASSSFKIYDTNRHVFSGTRGGDLNHTMNYDQSTTFRQGPTSLDKYTNYLQTFDANNNLITYITQTWDAATTSWVNNLRYRYQYDANNLQAGDTVDVWNTATNAWELSGAYAAFRNAAGKILISNSYNYDAATTTWDTTYQNAYNYDANNNPLEYITRQTYAGDLRNVNRQIYTYNASNICTYIVQQKWYPHLNNWRNLQAYAFVINAHNDRDIQYYSLWDTTATAWDSSSKYLYVYDASYRNTLLTYYTYVPADGSWKNTDQYTYSYNTHDQRTNYYSKTWNAGGFWENTSTDFFRSYYYEDYQDGNNTRIGELTQKGGNLKIWPVPAVDVLNLQLDWDEAQACTATIIDMQGHVCQTWSRGTASSVTEAINTDILPAGTYSIILHGSKNGMQRAMFTVVK